MSHYSNDSILNTWNHSEEIWFSWSKSDCLNTYFFLLGNKENYNNKNHNHIGDNTTVAGGTVFEEPIF